MEKKGNVVLFPFMAQGHLNPFLDLARLLALRTPTLTITIVSTPVNTVSLRPRFLSYPTVRFADLYFHLSDQSLPENAENTDALTTQIAISRFYHDSESLQPSFQRLISQITESDGGRPPICIISDMFLGWTVDVAHSFGSIHVPLYTSGPYAMSIYNSIWIHLPHKLTSADVITLPDLPGITIHRTQLSKNMIAAAEADDPLWTFTARQAEFCRRSDGSLWNTVDVLEKRSLENWAKSMGKPVWAIGPLLPISSKEYERGGKLPGLSPLECIEWLDKNPPNSVLFVSFGSQNSVPEAQMMELAHGLEQSGKAFIWVLRNPTGFDVGESFREEWLPEGFKDRMSERRQGLMVHNWAPQIEILSHKSTGAFLSHCGWNSVLESLSRGVPIIGWPLGSEQYYNSKMLEEELGVCVELARGFDATINCGDVAKLVRLMLEDDKGKEMRRKAEVLGEEMTRAVSEVEGVKGSSLRAFDDFAEMLMERAQKSNTDG